MFTLSVLQWLSQVPSRIYDVISPYNPALPQINLILKIMEMASVFSASREVPDSPLNKDISFNAFYNPMDTLLPLGGRYAYPPLKIR